VNVIGSVTGVAATQAAIGKRSEDMMAAIRATITSLSLKLLTRVKEQKLTGQVLNVRTGRLRRSITSEVETQGGQIVGMVGTNVEYAAAHEMGGAVDQRVRAHMRTAKQARGKAIKNPHAAMVRAHTRHIVYPKRSFLRSALDEMQTQIQSELARAVESAHAGS
jgi:phage gpG-like protein